MDIRKEFYAFIEKFKKESARAGKVDLLELFKDSLKLFEKLKYALETCSEDDKKMIFDLVNEMHKFLMQETQKIVEKTGMTEDQLSRFSENPDNFSSSQWKALELVKNELDQTAKELTTIIRGGKKEVTKKTTSLTRNKPSRKDRWLKS